MISIFLHKKARTFVYVIILSTLTESAVLRLLFTFGIIHSLFVLSLCVLYDFKDHNQENACIFTCLRVVLGILGIPVPVMKISIVI